MIRAIAAAAAISIALVACGGDNNDDSTPTSPPADKSSTPLADEPTTEAEATDVPSGTLVDARTALGPAADRFAEVQALRARFVATAAFGFQDRAFSGELAYRSPNASHLTSSFFGRPIEMLAYQPNYYINTPAQGWKAVEFASLTVNLDQLKVVVDNRGFFDLRALVDSLDEVQELPDSEISGVQYRHYRAEVELAQIADQLPGGIADAERLAEAEQFIENMQFDFWIARDTGLPRRVLFIVDTVGESDDGVGGLEMSVDYEEYNGAVEIPVEPVGAPPFSIEDLG